MGSPSPYSWDRYPPQSWDLLLPHSASTPLDRGSALEDPALMPTPAPSTSPPAPQVFEIRTTEDLTEEWLRERLAFFR